jgi:uncharacterized protein YecE (DUF72 family)
MESMEGPRFGSCSWNYDSWVGLVYSKPRASAAEYLGEYSQRYRTAEIDSWFYRLPEKRDVLSYLEAVDAGFRFTCKVTNEISLSHLRGRAGTALVANPSFLSVEKFKVFLERIEPMLPKLDAIMLEFEYLSREKMPSQAAFLDKLGAFLAGVGKGLPLAIEPRNANYLDEKYFAFARAEGFTHVWSERQFLPPIDKLFEAQGRGLGKRAVLRLLGGDRAEIEERTGGKWNAIVEPQAGRSRIARMIAAMARDGMQVTVNVNNHYEGSAPLTIAALEAECAAALAPG